MWDFKYIGNNQLLTQARNGYHYVYDSRDMGVGLHLLLYGWHEPWVSFALDKVLRPGDRVADVGANIGYHSVAIAKKIGPDGALWCFEPNVDAAKLLQRNLTMNGCVGSVVCEAVSNYVGIAALYISDDNMGVSSLQYQSGWAPHSVPVTSLDVFFSGDELDVLRMDAEGSEWRVLQRIDPLLDNGLRAIVFEHNPSYYVCHLDDCVQMLWDRHFISYVLSQQNVLERTSALPKDLPACDLLFTKDHVC